MYTAKVVSDAISPAQVRLTTLEIVFPRFILAEFNTHRMFSRNSASSRAIPTEKVIEQVRKYPFVPQFNRRVKGMGVGEPLSDHEQAIAANTWRYARDSAVRAAKALIDLDKSRVNRLLEPFMWHTCIVTSTEWSNFFALRVSEDAQPEMYKIAALMQRAMDGSDPSYLEYGQWALPYVSDEERKEHGDLVGRAISAGRCARVSYLTHDGRRDAQADISMHDRLVKDGHMSPLEHQGTPMPIRDRAAAWSGNLFGWHQYRKTIANEHDYSLVLAS